MKATRTRSAQPRAPRRWRTPPPLIRGSAETLEGMEILREVPGETGVLLWQAYRNVMFWATAEPQERGKLFAADAGQRRLEDLLSADVPSGIVDALVAVGRLLGAPEATNGDTLAEACRTIAEWAEQQGYDATSLAFTQTAALGAPRSATLALAVGQQARQRGEMPRAETWFRHAIMIARQIGDWDSYGRAYLALGNMARDRGNFPMAQRMHIKALRSGKRKGIAQIVGRASHDLFVIATETGRTEQAEHFARQAFRAYGPDHQRLPALAHDIAYSWMNQGYFARALQVFEALLPLFSDMQHQLMVRANIIRSAGGSGDRERFRKTWNEAMKLTREAAAIPVLADSLLEMARGAASMGEWDRAEQVAERALDVATERNEPTVLVRGEGILESIRNGRSVEKAVAARAGRGADQADSLAHEMVRSLESYAGV
ncbi:tetratricopeptide repeat protein [Longimicrobium sp.]|uniref:tetratricopeptide repeat protein n=1 Tax=Longimicrobium sp. TaxID=2029185 RepID=UPI002BDA5A02|nr:tetratricopeptide repeat protein [Longimicrobium sp.]HSU14479.1 tetratricopeptide repeat protein [Longimicrobium sp.]